MSGFKRFLSFVEISTKLASFLPFCAALAYTYYVRGALNVVDTLVFALAIFLFDMSVTAVNNYLDRREAGREGHFSRPVSLALIFGMSVTGCAIGLGLSYVHGLGLLIGGAVCVLAGMGYTFGPAPISKSPYGEVVSGGVQGFVFPYMVCVVNGLDFAGFHFSVSPLEFFVVVDIVGFAKLFLASLPMVLCIANLMLANNTCDYEKDLPSRYTLVRHIGVKHAVHLFTFVYLAVYLAIALSALLGVVPVTAIATFLTAPFVWKNVKAFQAEQVKSKTFLVAIKNFFAIVITYAGTVFAGALLGI